MVLRRLEAILCLETILPPSQGWIEVWEAWPQEHRIPHMCNVHCVVCTCTWHFFPIVSTKEYIQLLYVCGRVWCVVEPYFVFLSDRNMLFVCPIHNPHHKAIHSWVNTIYDLK